MLETSAEICAIAEPDVEQTHLIIKNLDAMEGRGTELARLPLDPHETGWSADLSVDGSRIAALKSPTSPISIVNLYDKTTTTIAVKNWSNLRSLRWAADGKGLFVGAGFSPGKSYLYRSRRKREYALASRVAFSSSPSPDGRHLAVTDHTMDRNWWIREFLTHAQAKVIVNPGVVSSVSWECQSKVGFWGELHLKAPQDIW